MVSTERPKANETPRRPMPTSGKAAANTALPQPPRTNQSVPRNSAVILCESENSSIAFTPPKVSSFGSEAHDSSKERAIRFHCKKVGIIINLVALEPIATAHPKMARREVFGPTFDMKQMFALKS